MIGFYIVFSLIGAVLISCLSRNFLQVFYYTLSIRERIWEQSFQFVQSKQAMEKSFQSKKNQFKQKTRHRQQSLSEANTRIQLRYLARETRKKLRCKQNNVPSEIQYSTKKAVKQCVKELDMERLININLSLFSPLNKLTHSQPRTEKINQTIHNERL